MHAAWGYGGVPCGRMSLRASTPSLSAHIMTTRAVGGGMPWATQLEREGEVVSQVWKSWFLKFDLPFCNYGTTHTAPCTMAKPMATRSPPPSTLTSPPPALFYPCPGHVGNAKDVGDMFNSNNAALVCFACARLLVCFD